MWLRTYEINNKTVHLLLKALTVCLSTCWRAAGLSVHGQKSRRPDRLVNSNNDCLSPVVTQQQQFVRCTYHCAPSPSPLLLAPPPTPVQSPTTDFFIFVPPIHHQPSLFEMRVGPRVITSHATSLCNKSSINRSTGGISWLLIWWRRHLAMATTTHKCQSHESIKDEENWTVDEFPDVRRTPRQWWWPLTRPVIEKITINQIWCNRWIERAMERQEAVAQWEAKAVEDKRPTSRGRQEASKWWQRIAIMA